MILSTFTPVPTTIRSMMCVWGRGEGGKEEGRERRGWKGLTMTANTAVWSLLTNLGLHKVK